MSMKVSGVDTVTAYSETDSHETGMDRKFYGSHAKLVREGIFSPENHGDWKDRTSFLSKKFTSDNDKSGLSFSVSGGASAEGGVIFTWGGSGDVEYSGYVKAEVHDDRGNYVEAKAEQNSDGGGSASLKGGHTSDDG